MRNTLIIIIIVLLVGAGVYFYFLNNPLSLDATPNKPSPYTSEEQNGSSMNVAGQENKDMTIIGTSVGGRDIVAYHFGSGEKELLFVGGIHGGYEWNTALLGNTLVDYLKTHPEVIPTSTKVTVIPVLNPDGLSKVVSSTNSFSAANVSPSQTLQVAGRFNGNTVDLNRNFDCDWQTNAVWQSKPVSGGSTAFSEPESVAVKNYIAAHKPTAAVVWYSSAGGVFASNCHNGVSTSTQKITNVYAKASGYPAYESFDFYEVTGDMVNWLAKSDIPAISVLLTNHTDIEWAKNLAGIQAFLQHYAQ
ncbi:MAG: M14 family zinc carboxypeptidase [Patescibacteria group bacterium]